MRAEGTASSSDADSSSAIRHVPGRPTACASRAASAGGVALGHRQQQRPRRVDQARAPDGAAPREGRGEVEPAEEVVLRHAGREAAQGAERALGGGAEGVADRSRPCAQDEAAEARRVEREQMQRQDGAVPGRGRLAHPSTSSTTRPTRAPEPASSSGSRRSRWRSARGATARTWERDSAVSSR